MNEKTDCFNGTMGLTPDQCRDVELFLDRFAEIEQALKARLGRKANDRTGIAAMIDSYAGRNSNWKDSANRLRCFSEIRNLLTHQRGTSLGYPVAVTSHSLHGVQEILKNLQTPEPVSKDYKDKVQNVADTDSLSTVLGMVVASGFSQFPVMNSEQFSGEITENEIIRWLGHQTSPGRTKVDLSAVTVKTLRKERDPFLEGLQILHFEKLDAPVDEVISRFSTEPMLEVILLTHSGRKDTPLEGMVTQWDAARHPSRLRSVRRHFKH
jgi:hypothetical protein